jgi:hypothetical protein
VRFEISTATTSVDSKSDSFAEVIMMGLRVSCSGPSTDQPST